MIWLPTQGQLQKMLNEPYETLLREFIYWLDDGLHDLCWNLDKQLLKQFTSIEQLWLAYIMWKKYNKIWNEKEQKWVKKEVKK